MASCTVTFVSVCERATAVVREKGQTLEIHKIINRSNTKEKSGMNLHIESNSAEAGWNLINSQLQENFFLREQLEDN